MPSKKIVFEENPEKVVDIDAIMQLIPHRYPMLLVDRVLDWLDDGIVAIKNVSANEPWVQGHFPGNPIYPAVYTLEGAAQTALLLAMLSDEGNLGKQPRFTGLEEIKFRREIIPGDMIVYHVCVDNAKKTKAGTVYFFTAKIFVGDEPAGSGLFKAILLN